MRLMLILSFALHFCGMLAAMGAGVMYLAGFSGSSPQLLPKLAVGALLPAGLGFLGLTVCGVVYIMRDRND